MKKLTVHLAVLTACASTGSLFAPGQAQIATETQIVQNVNDENTETSDSVTDVKVKPNETKKIVRSTTISTSAAPEGDDPDAQDVATTFTTGTPQDFSRSRLIIGDGFANTGQEGRTLVIPASEMDSKEYAQVNQDLAVMSRILEKAAGKASQDNESFSALNIPLHSVSLSRSWRSLHLDGYGALFFLNVRMPLVGPPASTAKEKAPTQDNSTWEQTKRELYGARPSFDFGYDIKLEQRLAKPEAFDEQKVEKLKRSLLEALKNAANLRHLKPDETITIVVTGGNTSGIFRVLTMKRDRQNKNELSVAEPETRHSGAPGQSVMTIRVKKADVDAYAAGKLSFEEFSAKASTLNYGGSGKLAKF